MRLVFKALSLLVVSTLDASAAGLGGSYDNYRDLHEKTAYWSLFFNETAIRYRDSRMRMRFRMVEGEGSLDLPAQQGYCFVINHYTDDPDLVAADKKYRVEIRKTARDGSVVNEKPLERSFSPTDDRFSVNMPDICLSSTFNIATIELKFTSDGSPDRSIAFNLK
jgi:hypothetical protein